MVSDTHASRFLIQKTGGGEDGSVAEEEEKQGTVSDIKV